MTTSTELVATEQPQALITIEPAKYVELVFEPFAKRLDAAKELARTTTYDVKTTAGMATAVKLRATFRDIRVESEKARKIRKAPILEIGKLLDSRQKEIEAEIEPFESEPDAAIKAEEQRKEAEKAAKLATEKARVDSIRARIDAMRNRPAEMVGRPSDEISAVADALSETVISLEEYAEFAGEGQVERNAAVAKLREMQAAQLAVEQEHARLAAERAQLAKEREEAAERERKAEAARAEREAAERDARRIVDEEQRLIQERAAAAMREQQAEHDRRMAEQQANADKLSAATSEVQGIQQQVIIATQGRLGVRKGGTIDCIRDTLAETEAWEIDPERFGILAGAAESAKTTAVAEIRRLLAEAEARQREDAEARRQHEEAEREVARQEAEAAQAAAEKEAKEHAERDAAEREALRRVRVQFEKNGPGDAEIVAKLAAEYDVAPMVVVGWLEKFNASAFRTPEEKAA